MMTFVDKHVTSAISKIISKIKNYEVASGGGTGKARVSPSPDGKKMEIRKCLDR